MRTMRWIARGLAALMLSVLLLGCALHVVNSQNAMPPASPDDALRIATHNVHYIVLGQDTGRWSRGNWEARKGALDAAFKSLDADLVAFQEMESFQRGSDGSVNLARDWLLARNPDYGVAASGDWRDFPSTQPVLYRKARLTPVDQGWFFFSDTPDVIYSPTFNGSYPAFCSWVLFETSQGQRLRVFNVHFEYKSRSNRLKSADLVARRMAPYLRPETDEAVVLMGDLNALYGARTMEFLQEPGLDFARIPGATYHMDRGLNLFGAIDHIGLGAGATLTGGPWVVQRQFDGRWPSDHYPVVADIALP